MDGLRIYRTLRGACFQMSAKCGCALRRASRASTWAFGGITQRIACKQAQSAVLGKCFPPYVSSGHSDGGAFGQPHA